ncbi:MAG: SMP-30/gluconolactonase/LRE family protein, partial [Pseudomonadota bacterium]
GTMGKAAEPGAGAFYRYYRGELRCLMDGITITNSICFAPDGTTAYFCDTITKQIMATRLDGHGWPKGDPWVALDLTVIGAHPDGSVVDAKGNIWTALWGDGEIVCHSANGARLQTVSVPAAQVSCPAFAGATGRLFATTSCQGLTDAEMSANPNHGQTFETTVQATGQLEHQVIL